MGVVDADAEKLLDERRMRVEWNFDSELILICICFAMSILREHISSFFKSNSPLKSPQPWGEF